MIAHLALLAASLSLGTAPSPLGLAELVELPLFGGEAVLECFDLVREHVLITKPDAYQLCDGTNTTGPAECFIAARDSTMLTPAEAITLCRCAAGTEPVDCYLHTFNEGLLDESRRKIFCQATVIHRLRADCLPIWPYSAIPVPSSPY
jgi:hypothetical protein